MLPFGKKEEHKDSGESRATKAKSTEIPQMARELASQALGRANPRFTLYRSQDPEFREGDVVFWSRDFEKCLSEHAQESSSGPASAE